MKKVARNFKDDTNGGRLSGAKYAIVAANNHYAGFGSGTVNIFRQLLGLEEVKWGDEFVSIDDLEKDDVVGMRKLTRLKLNRQVYLTSGNNFEIIRSKLYGLTHAITIDK